MSSKTEFEDRVAEIKKQVSDNYRDANQRANQKHKSLIRRLLRINHTYRVIKSEFLYKTWGLFSSENAYLVERQCLVCNKTIRNFEYYPIYPDARWGIHSPTDDDWREQYHDEKREKEQI